MEKISSIVKVFALITPITMYFLIETILKKEYLVAVYIALHVFLGICASYIWVKNRKVKT